MTFNFNNYFLDFVVTFQQEGAIKNLGSVKCNGKTLPTNEMALEEVGGPNGKKDPESVKKRKVEAKKLLVDKSA